MIAAAALFITAAAFAEEPSPIVDTIAFGDVASEASHGFSGKRSEIISGGLGEPARSLLPHRPIILKAGARPSRSRLIRQEPITRRRGFGAATPATTV
jgi:hypothetical protein